ncbi:MAG TPA: ATP-dependent DNA ligase, partial [Amycolatopsis sp.]|nr:ATP-dependent DNA ligase [Amycolatopsis sp.]
GGRGFHVVAPLDAKADTDVVLKLSRAIADSVAEDDPENLTTAQRKDRRGSRIFLDANRNGYAQTFVAPYSLRARPGAPIATPLDWNELGKADPDGWDPARMRHRLARKEDPWRDIGAAAASAEDALARLG